MLLARWYIVLLFAVVGIDARFVAQRAHAHMGHVSHARLWAEGRWCLNDNECGRGVCRVYACQCFRGYTTWKFMDVCNYEQRTKSTAFLVSFFVGMCGVDWFVLSRGNAAYIITGLLKLIITSACCLVWPYIIIAASRATSRSSTIGTFINVIFSVISFVWWLADWIRVLADVFYDGNEVPLQNWHSNSFDRMGIRP
jgi:TM2 domain-containing membrane protein YozV